MIIGTVRVEEAKVFDSEAGFHAFHDEEGGTYGRFEVFWHEVNDEYDECFWGKAGWYWWACFEGCLPDSEPVGPFAHSLRALCDADEFHPDYLEED
jgi:hypothetical protein